MVELQSWDTLSTGRDRGLDPLLQLSSLEESRYYLILAPDLGYGPTDVLVNSAEEVSRLLNAYARAILAPDFSLLCPAAF